MPLNIKDDFVHEQAKQIAAITGESLTQVVRRALADRLQIVQKRSNTTATKSVEQLMALTKICADNKEPGSSSADHANIYGSDGLPI